MGQNAQRDSKSDGKDQAGLHQKMQAKCIKSFTAPKAGLSSLIPQLSKHVVAIVLASPRMAESELATYQTCSTETSSEATSRSN